MAVAFGENPSEPVTVEHRAHGIDQFDAEVSMSIREELHRPRSQRPPEWRSPTNAGGDRLGDHHPARLELGERWPNRLGRDPQRVGDGGGGAGARTFEVVDDSTLGRTERDCF